MWGRRFSKKSVIGASRRNHSGGQSDTLCIRHGTHGSNSDFVVIGNDTGPLSEIRGYPTGRVQHSFVEKTVVGPVRVWEARFLFCVDLGSSGCYIQIITGTKSRRRARPTAPLSHRPSKGRPCDVEVRRDRFRKNMERRARIDPLPHATPPFYVAVGDQQSVLVEHASNPARRPNLLGAGVGVSRDPRTSHACGVSMGRGSRSAWDSRPSACRNIGDGSATCVDSYVGGVRPRGCARV